MFGSCCRPKRQASKYQKIELKGSRRVHSDEGIMNAFEDEDAAAPNDDEVMLMSNQFTPPQSPRDKNSAKNATDFGPGDAEDAPAPGKPHPAAVTVIAGTSEHPATNALLVDLD